MATFEKENEVLQDRSYRQHLDRNWSNGDKKFEAQDKRMADMGETDYPGSNEVTQARISVDGTEHTTLNGRLDDDELQAQKTEEDVNSIEKEIEDARTNVDGVSHETLKGRLDGSNKETKNARGTFGNLAGREDNQDQKINANEVSLVNTNKSIEEVRGIAKAANGGGPKGTYATLDDLKKDKPDGSRNIYLVSADGHWYYYSGGWKDGGAYQSSGLEDGSVSYKKLNDVVKSEIDRFVCMHRGDIYVDTEKSTITMSNSDFILQNMTQHLGMVDDFNEKITIPKTKNNFLYLLVVVLDKDNKVSKAMVEGYDKFDVSNQYIVGFFINGIFTAPFTSIRRVHPRMYNQLASFNDTGNVVLDFKNKEVRFNDLTRNVITTLDYKEKSTPTLNNLSFKDLAKNKICVLYVSKKNKIDICIYNDLPDNGVLLLAAFKPTGEVYNIYGNMMPFIIKDNQGTQVYPKPDVVNGSNFVGKTINMLGDSYVKNNNNPVEKTWHYKLAQKYNMTYNNYGINGNGMVASKGTGTPMVDRFNEMKDGADYIVVIGGKNDYNKQLSISDFKTGIKKMIKGLVAKYPDGNICFFTPWSIGDNDDKKIKLSEYAQAIVDECNLFGIACFNANEGSNITPWDADFRKKYMQSENDVSHLNGEGHDRFLPRAEAFLNSL